MLNNLFAKFLLAALLCVSLIANAKDQILVMTISDYETSTLHGVKHDAKNALQLASKLGYETAGAITLKDRELTAAGLRKAFKTFAQNISQGDRAFIYYSGHGASFKDGSSCAQALVSQDEKLVQTQELVAYIDAVKSKVSDAIVIFDACFAGGNNEIAQSGDRSVKSNNAVTKLNAKVWTPKDGESCSEPINVIRKDWDVSTRGLKSMTNPEFNFTFIAAANEREIALDNPSAGGLATVGLLTCTKQGVKDVNNSFSIDYAEIVSCAQDYVTEKVAYINTQTEDTYLPHTIEIYGNTERTVPVESITESSAEQDSAAKMIAAFHSLQANSNGNWGFWVEPSSNEIKIGQDFNIQFESDRPGYIYMLYVGSDNQDMQQVWPAIGQHIQISAGENTTPTLEMHGPTGDNTVLMLVSQNPVNFAPFFNPDGAVAISTNSLTDINCVMQNQRNIKLKDDGDCQSTKRNIVLKDEKESLGSMAGYSARLVIVKGAN